MQLGQFDLFCQVARVKSFSKAAKLLHISQPAISAQVHSMEEFYGIKLFERTPHGVTLTPAGVILFDSSKKILELHEDLERTLAGLADEKNQKLIIGATPTVGSHALACGIWTFKDKYPDLQIHLEIGNPQEIITKMYEKTIDLAIIECPVQGNKGLTRKSVFTDQLVAIVPNNEHWSAKTSVTIDDLTSDRLILREENMGEQRLSTPRSKIPTSKQLLQRSAETTVSACCLIWITAPYRKTRNFLSVILTRRQSISLF